MQEAYIALGSNLADPEKQILKAFEELKQLPKSKVIKRSPLYRSKAIGPYPQPDFINAVVKLNTSLDPYALLQALFSLETQHGRVRREKWGARTLDLDLLLYGRQILESEKLTLPHPQMANRNFVLIPLGDIAPDLILPQGIALRDLLVDCPYHDLEKLEAQTL